MPTQEDIISILNEIRILGANTQKKGSNHEQQEEKILAQSDAFISLLAKRGILAGQKIDSERVRPAKQEKVKDSYHNTLMLLQQ